MSDAPPKPPDPFQVLRQSYDQATEAWAQAVEQAISTEEFAASAGKLMERYTEMQEVLRKTSEAVAEQLHIPTKDDIARVAQLVINVERKVDDVSDLADDLLRKDDGSAAVGALGDRLAALEERLAGVASRLDALDGLDAIAGRLEALDRIEARLDGLEKPAPAPAPPPPAAEAPAEPAETPKPPARRARTSAKPPAEKGAPKAAPARPARRRSTRTTAKEE